MSLPEKDLQRAINEEVGGKGSPAMFARRLMRNFQYLDKRLPNFTPFAETLLDDDDAAAARATLGINSFGTRFGTDILSAPTSVAMSADTAYYHSVLIHGSPTLTGVQLFSLTAAGTCRVALYDSAGTRVADRTSDSSTLSVAALQIPFSATYAASPGLYFVSVVFSGTPDIIATVAAQAGSAAGPGSNATATSITPPTTVAQVPILTTY